MLSLAAITVVLRSNFIRPSQLIAALIRPKALFVTSPHPLATVTVFPRPCGLLEALKHGLHSYFGATPRRAFSSAAHCFCGLTVRRCGHSLCVLNFSRFLARLCGWSGIAVLPCFSASGKVPVTRCGLPLRGTYAAYWPSSRLERQKPDICLAPLYPPELRLHLTLPTAKAGGFMVRRQQPQRHESLRGITLSPHALRSGPSDPTVETQLTPREALILHDGY